ncbi:MAG: hypothetical protein KKB50_12540 [Planctomycetes bacterium]|nr:hypothetical protein [Planctomycetota bacterium]
MHKAREFSEPVVRDAEGLVFGWAPAPVTCGLGLTLGAGLVYPEINFTLPPMLVEHGTWPRVRQIYEDTITALLERAQRLALPGLVVEFEQLPPMTKNPAWGAELSALLKDHLRRAHERWGLAAALRVTIIDLRDETKPPRRREGAAWEQMAEALECCVAAGADILSIESTGGKEVHDVALTRADLPGILLALGVLAPRDMAWLWDHFVAVANQHGIVAGGDTACGFANTAMQLSEQGMLPDGLAALVRAVASVRSLVAFERGAVGPSKDCAYEGPVLKAISGCPISMEGRGATCAHLSPVGNIALAMADLWSNESVPDVRLLSGPAPVASLETLAYDCRLLNAATARGTQLELRDLHVESDAHLSAQAALLSPAATLRLARAICAEREPYRRALAVGGAAFQILQEGLEARALELSERERRWLDRLQNAYNDLPESAGELIETTRARYGELYDPATYGLGD